MRGRDALELARLHVPSRDRPVLVRDRCERAAGVKNWSSAEASLPRSGACA
ncbi:MAG: hypothetical protein ABR961_04935 [Thermoanaerobaculaceae bacterium]|jgi:hypothetical protein